MDATWLGWTFAATFAALTAWQAVRQALARTNRRARARRAHAGERRAATLLRRHGYRIVASQLRQRWSMRVDGVVHPFELRADLLVTRRGRRLIAEVKTGALAPRLDHAPTRRQLLEYGLAFDVDGVLLVDAETGTVREVVFPRSARTTTAWAIWLGAGAALGATATWWLLT